MIWPMKRNDVFSLMLILVTLDNLFNILLFLAGILFIISVTEHHHLSLTLCLQSPAVLTQPRPCSHTPSHHYPPPEVITHPRAPTVVLLIFVNTCPAGSVYICRLCPPPLCLPTPYRLLIPHSPPHNSRLPAISSAVRLSSRPAITCVSPY